MSNERLRILKMLAEGKITAEEAEKLLDALEHKSGQDLYDQKEPVMESEPDERPKHLFITVNPKTSKGEKVNIKIPLQIIRAGVKLKSILPESARAKVNAKFRDKGIGVDLNDLDSKSLEDMLRSMEEFAIDVEDDDETVKIFCR